MKMVAIIAAMVITAGCSMSGKFYIGEQCRTEWRTYPYRANDRCVRQGNTWVCPVSVCRGIPVSAVIGVD